VLYGATNPVAATGIDGNFYINTSTNFMFGPKAAGAWPAGTSLIGPQGPVGPQGVAGNTILYGNADPTAGQGINGNFYINTTTNFLFGPKASGAWPAGTSLIGPQGLQGPQGPQGVAGAGSPSTIPPLMDGVAGVGTSTNFSREDHIHPSDTSRAPLASPAFTGTPTAPTPAAADNSTRVATTAFTAVSSVRADIAQSLTLPQQVQARQNIFAAPFDALAYNGMQINGSMEASQERGTTVRTTPGYVCDGWNINWSGSMVLNGQQVVDAPGGYNNSIKVTVTTAQPSLAASDQAIFYTLIEGYRVSRLAFGTPGAQPLSFAFWVKANRPGTYSGVVINGGQTRAQSFTFTINSANTWEYKTVTIAVGDATGTWAKDNTVGLFVLISLAVGSGGMITPGSWVATAVGAARGAPGSTNGVAATTDTFQFTGFVVLPGIELPSSDRSPLIMRPYDQELPTCKRYYQAMLYPDAFISFGMYALAGAQPQQSFTLLAEMRSLPTALIAGTWSVTNCGQPIALLPAKRTFAVYTTITATGTFGCNNNSAGAGITIDARL
jgi:hypothetical protein